MRIAFVGGLLALVLASLAPVATADVGPRRPDPARDACSGLQDGAACVVNDKAGICHGPHVSRLYCQVAPSAGAGSAGSGAGSAATDTGSAAPPSENAATAGSATSAASTAAGSGTGSAEPAPTPGHKRGCAVAEPGSAAVVGLALAALALGRRRRRSRSMP